MQHTSSLGTRKPWLIKDSAFFPFSDPDATSARNRSPAEMWTRLNCADNRLVLVCCSDVHSYCRINSVSSVLKSSACYARGAEMDSERNVMRLTISHLVYNLLALRSFACCRGPSNHNL